jgi:Family of unknown function (DUF6510)
MSDPAALDGNAIAGALLEVFRVEMTTALGTCATCGTRALLAECDVYLRAPGIVGRCRACQNVLIVLVAMRGVTCVDLGGFTALTPASEAAA